MIYIAKDLLHLGANGILRMGQNDPGLIHLL